MSAGIVQVRLAPAEELQLRHLIEDFRELIGAERDSADPAVARLTPSPYPGDSDAAHEFRAATEDDLLGRRDADAVTVVAALASTEQELVTMAEEKLFAERERGIPVEDLDAWLRTLTALRLVIATRLGIDREEHHDPDDARFGVYDWLGYRLELLIEAAEEQGF